MKVNHQLTVLSLFLLVPASIICAQTTYLTGTVSLEQDYRTVNFNSKQGNVKVLLPGILSHPGQGTVLLQGTVITEPSGKSEKERSSNLRELQKMVLTIGQKPISILPGQNPFEFSVPPNLATPVPIDMVDPGGNRARVEIPNKALPDLPPSAGQPPILADQKVFITNGNIPVYAAYNGETLFQPTDKFFIRNTNGTMTALTKLAQSPTQTVLSGTGIQPGSATIVRQTATRTDELNIRMATLSLTSPNTNLRRGQTSSLTVTIDPKITDKDSAEAMQIPVMSLDIKNLTPSVIDMAGGNYQVMTFPTGSNPRNMASWQATRTITGVKPGAFNVSSTLYPSEINTNSVHAQLEEVKTPEDFNNWANAIKRDLHAYLQATAPNSITLRNLTQRAIDHMPSTRSDADVADAKIFAKHLLRSLPAFTNNMAGEGYAAFATYMAQSERLKNSGPIIDWPLHTDAIDNGLHFIQQNTSVQSYPLIDKQLNDVLRASRAVQLDYSTKNISELSTALLSMNSSPVVTGLADVTTVLYPHKLEADGPIGANMNGHEVTPDDQVIRFYDDGAIIIYANGIRYIFKAVTANGTSLKSIMEKYDDPSYPMPTGVDCDSLKRICKKTEALTLFWGDVYSMTQGVAESKVLKGVTKEKFSQTSLLITRGWEMDCCRGLFRLKLFFQIMGPGQSFSFTKILSFGQGYPCPIPNDCPGCKNKCDADKKMRHQ